MSSRMRCPFLKRFAVAKGSIVIWKISPGVSEFRVLPCLAVAASQDAIGQVHGIAGRIIVRGRIDIDQLCGEIRVERIRRDPQLDRDGTDDGDVLLQRQRLEREDIPTGRERQPRVAAAEELRSLALVERPAFEDRLAARQCAADRRHRIRRIEVVAQGSGTRIRRRLAQLPVIVNIEGPELGLGQRPARLLRSSGRHDRACPLRSCFPFRLPSGRGERGGSRSTLFSMPLSQRSNHRRRNSSQDGVTLPAIVAFSPK